MRVWEVLDMNRNPTRWNCIPWSRELNWNQSCCEWVRVRRWMEKIRGSWNCRNRLAAPWLTPSAIPELQVCMFLVRNGGWETNLGHGW